MPSLIFFAADDDLSTVLEQAERKFRLRYYLCGDVGSMNPEWLPHWSELPSLGHASKPAASLDRAYLITESTAEVEVRCIDTQSGRRYLVDQLRNPNSVVLQPGGRFDSVAVISGKISSVSKDGFAGGLFKAAGVALRRSFVRVKSYWVGPHAMRFLQDGGRLTTAIQSPPPYDLSID